MLPDGDHPDGSGAGASTGSDEARATSARLYRRLQAVWLAGEGHSATRVAAITGASARSVRYWCATRRRSKEHGHPAKGARGEAAPGTAADGARPGPRAPAGRVGHRPAEPRLRGDELEGAAPCRAPAKPRIFDQPARLASPPARRGPALEASPLRLCRTCPTRRPEKRALVRAMKKPPADGRLLARSTKPRCATCRPCAPRGRCAQSSLRRASAVRMPGAPSLARSTCARGAARAPGQDPPASGGLPPLFASAAPRRGSLWRALVVAGSPRQPL
jgi:hypothetical protein